MIVSNSELANLKPNWLPKADIPSAVPKLPPEYIHRHRLMKQVVNCLLDKNGAGPRDVDEEVAVRILLLFTSVFPMGSYSHANFCSPTDEHHNHVHYITPW
jgi:hypothetical protein